MQTLEYLEKLAKLVRTHEILTRNEFVQALKKAGVRTREYHPGVNFRCPHPREEGRFLEIDFQDCYCRPGNDYPGYFSIDVVWDVPCDEFDCEHDCDCESHPQSRKMTLRELDFAVQEWIRQEIRHHQAKQIDCEILLAVIEKMAGGE